MSDKIERSEMPRGITSIAEAEKAIKKLDKYWCELHGNKLHPNSEKEVYVIEREKALEILRELEASVREDILDLFNGKIRWANICPPERRGAEIALIKILLKVSWERANEIAFMASEEELRRVLEGEKG